MDRPTAHDAAIFRLLRLGTPQWRLLSLGTACLVLAGLMQLSFPQVIARLLDLALEEGRSDRMGVVVGVLLGIFLLHGIAVLGRSYYFSLAGERIVASMRQKLYGRLLDQEIAFFDQERTGELLNRLATDTTVLQSTICEGLAQGLRCCTLILGGVILLLHTAFALGLLMLAVVPPLSLAVFYFGRQIRRMSRQVQDALARSSEVAEEAISGIRTVRSFSAEEYEKHRYGAAVEESLELARRRVLYASIFFGSASVITYGALAFVLWHGAGLVSEGKLSIGHLSAFLVYTLMVAFSVIGLAHLWAQLMRAGGAIGRVFELLDRVPALAVGKGIRLDRIRGEVVFRDVDFCYPARPDLPVLAQVDLSLCPGRVVALVGPSGGGKSTIAALICRFYDPDEGQLLLDGVDLRELDSSWLRRQIGVVSQEPLLFSLSLKENLRYGKPDAQPEEVERAARAAGAWEFIEQFPDGLDTLVGERGVQLSGGQKQRVAIARALLRDPRILILDEATSALDAESEARVKQALEKLMHGRTTLVIAHRLSTVKDADEVVVVDGGRIVERGDHASLVERDGIYRRLLEAQLVSV